jgi:hypothetical protein
MAISKKDAELLAFAKNFSAKINISPEQWGLTPQLAADFQVLLDRFATSYAAVAVPELRSKVLTAQKDADKAALLANARGLYRIVQGTPGVTDAQRIEIGVNVRKAAAPIPVPDEAPGMSVLSVFGRTIRLSIHDQLVTRKGRPPGTAGAMVFSHVGDEPPPTIDGWRSEENATRTVTVVNFPADVQPGAKVWFCACYYNPRGQRGPISTPILSHVGFEGVLSRAA